MGDATPQNVKQRLDSMEEYQFRRSSTSVPEEQPVWTATVTAELTEAQRAAWKAEVEQRSAFRDGAIGAVIVAEFDRKYTLSPEQWTALAPKMAQFLQEYAPDIASSFSSFNSTPWYLQSYTMFMPFAGIPEAELKTILGKEGWGRWSGSDEFSNTISYWENVQQSHEQRTKKAKP